MRQLTRRELLLAATIFGLKSSTRPKYIPSVGQSLSTGGAGNPAITLSQPYTNRMFVGGDVATWYADAPPSTSIASLVPLIEGVSHDVESHCSGFANQIAAWARVDGLSAYEDTIQGSWGVGGQCYSALKKGTTPYTDSMASVTKAFSLAPGLIVPAILCVHGECDGPSAYAPKILEWQSDMETDIKAITGQTGIIPMFHSQTENDYYGGFRGSGGMLEEQEYNGTKNILVGPKYFLPHQPDNTHLINTSYLWMGEYYAKAYYQHVVRGIQWTPLRPISLSVSGAVITIQYTGMIGSLVFDGDLVPAAGTVNGFKYTEGNGVADPAVQSVAITNAAAGIVQVTLDRTPAGSGYRHLQYAISGTAPFKGNLRDSDPLVGRSGNHLYNWAVCFDKPIVWTP